MSEITKSIHSKLLDGSWLDRALVMGIVVLAWWWVQGQVATDTAMGNHVTDIKVQNAEIKTLQLEIMRRLDAYDTRLSNLENRTYILEGQIENNRLKGEIR
jgi:hypothetical protein